MTEDDAHRVGDFVRLAEQSVGRLVSDAEVAETPRSAMAPQPGDDEIDRLLRAQQVLARVMAFERVAVGGQRLSSADVEALQARTKLALEDQVRLLSELSQGEHERTAMAIAIDLITCRVVAATAGDEIDDWSEPPASIRG